MRKIYALTVALLAVVFAKGQDNCSNATQLCANNTIASTTFGGTFDVSDPALSCGDLTVNNSMWYTVEAISNGTCNVTVGLINNNPGLEMEVFSGTCGSLISIGACNSANGPGGSMNVTFGVLAGTTYYIMIDGSSGNQESFSIQATSATSSILGRPIPGFIPSTVSGCAPLSVLMINTTIVSGGSNITYQWRMDAGAYVPATGNDTTFLFTTSGTHTVDLKVCNDECGCASVTQFFDVEELVATITPPAAICPGVPVDFAADAQYLPDPPFTPVNIVSWDWDFGDPSSGSNTASGQNVQHAFSDSGDFLVTLIVTSGDCGTDTVTANIHVNPGPTVYPGPDQYICEFEDDTVTAIVTNGSLPITYQWSGVGIFSCDTCATTIVGGLSAGGPYPISIHVVDVNGCFADSSVNIIVNPKPVLDAGSDTTVCPYTSLQLNANVVQGTPPLTFSWSPSAGLNNSTLQNPMAFISAPIAYCVTAQDSIGCVADTICVNIALYPPPAINASPGVVCASDPNPVTTLDVTGPGPGSTYAWGLSPDYALITGANADSSSITISFPTGIATTYDFTCVVTDGTTGCMDTATFSYNVVAGLNMVVSFPPGACIGIASTLTASGANTYAWTASPAYPFADSTLASQLVMPSDTTVFSVTGTVGTCTQVVSDTVVVYPRPNINVFNDSTICPNTPVQIFALATGGTNPYNYAWYPSAGLNDSLQQNPFASISAPSTFCAAAVDFHGCISDTQCVDLDVFPPPSISAAPSTLCASAPNPQTVFTVSGAGPGSTYNWGGSVDYALITSSNIDSSAVTISLPQNSTATYSFSVTVTDAVTGCVTILAQTFTMTTGLNMSVSGPSAFCEGDSATLTVSGASTYAWSASPAYTFTDSTSATQTLAPVVSTMFTISGNVPGCSQVITYTLNVNPKPDAVASPIPDFCGCTTANLTGILSTPGMGYSWTSTAGNIITNANQVNASSAICTSDSFVLVVTDTTTGCMDTSSVNVHRNAPPAAFALPNPNMICDATTTTVLLDGTGSDTTSGTVYLWTSNNPSALLADSSAIVTTATISTATIFFLTVTDSLGCDSIYTDSVSIYPTPSIGAANPFICTSDPVLEATVNIIGASPGSTYLWDTIPACVTPATASGSSQLFDFTTCGPGIYNFSILVTDSASGCIKRVNQTVTVVTGVTLVVSPDAIICEGDSTTLNVSGANSFLWSPGGETTDSVNVTGLSAGSYQYIVTGTIGTCVSSDTIDVLVNPSPQTTPIIGPLVVCAGVVGQAYDVTPLAGNYTWTITNGTITSGQGTGSIIVDWGTAGAGLLSVIDTNSFGCPGIVQTTNVTINPIPVTSPINGPDSVCENSLATYFINPNAGSSYSWSVINGTIMGSGTNNIVTIQWGSAGSGTLQISETNAVGCSGTPVTLTVYIFPVPNTPSIQGATTVCAGDTTQIYSTALIGGATYVWTVIGGTVTSGMNTDSITVTWDTSTVNGGVNVSVINQYGCASPIGSIGVSIVPLPNATVSPDSITLCRNIPLQITGSYNYGSIVWTTSGSGTFSDSTIVSPTYIPGPTDSGFVTLTMVLSSLTCGNDTVHVVLNAVPAPNTIITALPNDTICFGDTTTLTAAGGISYLWLNNFSSIDSIVISPTSDSVFTVIASNAFNCPDTESVTIHVNQPGIANAGADLISCQSDSIFLIGSSNSGGIYWSTLGDGTFSDTTQLTAYYYPGGVDTTSGAVAIIVTATGACSNLNDTMIISFNQPPTVNAGPDTLLSGGSGSGVSVPLSTVTSYSSSVHFTTSGSGTFSPNDSDITGSYIPSADDYGMDSVVITATATGPCGTVTDYFIIEFTPFTIPNVFTPYPASPGYNDYFEIRNIPPGCKLKIWDRWGLMVYSSEDYQNDWDAHGLNADVFYYVLETKQKNFHGWIRTIRDEK